MKNNNSTSTASKLEALVSNQISTAIENAKASKKQPKTKKESKPEPEAKIEEVTKEVTNQQNLAIVEKVISNREVKYLYPADVVDTLARKRWRQATRNELHTLERKMHRIQDQNSKEYQEAKREYEKFLASHLKPNQIA
jgi:hypothetical protein